jgi:epoxyqueuosine reductase
MDAFEQLKAEAEHLGFSLSGWVSAARPAHFDLFTSWLAGGFHAGMSYLARPDTLAKREHPLLLMEGARSILSLAYPYQMQACDSTVNKPEYGSIAAYACLPDYHGRLAARVEELAQRVNSQLEKPFHYRVFTDSAPILERDLAWQAGLGWVGRNGCLIHAQHGSAFFLAELVTDLDLPPAASEPVTDHCGNCRRCLEACPTRCIREDRTIDARHCISYLTIEHRGHIPVDLLSAINTHVFGCDDCQTCCPWVIKTNRSKSIPEEEMALAGYIDVCSELGLTETEFKSHFGGYPVARARWEGYIRNLAIVAGNQRDANAIDALSGLLSSSQSAVIRLASAWALGQIGTASVQPVLESHLSEENDPDVQVVVRAALEKLN